MPEQALRASPMKNSDIDPNSNSADWAYLYNGRGIDTCRTLIEDMPTKNSIIAAYLRVSSDKQDEAMQKTYLETVFKQRGIKESDIHWFVDHDVSAKKCPELTDRPEGKKLQEMVDDGVINSIYCYKIDRLFRNVWAGHKFVASAQMHGTDIFSMETPSGILDDNGFLLYSIHFMMAEMEVRKLARRTADGMAHHRQNGGVTTSAVFGWDVFEVIDEKGNPVIGPNDKVVKKMAPNWQEQAVINWMREMDAKGWSRAKIARTLNDLNVRGKKGGKWQGQSVTRCLDAKQHLELVKFTPPKRMMKYPFTDLRKKQIKEFD